jgi:hypothetical protein
MTAISLLLHYYREAISGIGGWEWSDHTLLLRVYFDMKMPATLYTLRGYPETRLGKRIALLDS